MLSLCVLAVRVVLAVAVVTRCRGGVVLAVAVGVDSASACGTRRGVARVEAAR